MINKYPTLENSLKWESRKVIRDATAFGRWIFLVAVNFVFHRKKFPIFPLSSRGIIIYLEWGDVAYFWIHYLRKEMPRLVLFSPWVIHLYSSAHLSLKGTLTLIGFRSANTSILEPFFVRYLIALPSFGNPSSSSPKKIASKFDWARAILLRRCFVEDGEELGSFELESAPTEWRLGKGLGMTCHSKTMGSASHAGKSRPDAEVQNLRNFLRLPFQSSFQR